jgi:2-C-methyl-D-erythritol 4-phosphate cytidylyltransferase
MSGGRRYNRGMRVVALVLGAGAGLRLGAARPKGLVELRGRSLLEWSCRALARAPSIEGVLPVIPPGSDWTCGAVEKLLAPTEGGKTRQASLARGLAALRRTVPECEWVLVHDAARCLVRPRDAEAVLEAARGTGAAVPIAPLADTIKEIEGERIVRTLDRGRIGAAQTPQAFRRALLEEALTKAEQAGFVASDCASLLERLGLAVAVCPGRAENFKITCQEDIARAAALLVDAEDA